MITIEASIGISGWHPVGIWCINWSGGSTAMKMQTFRINTTKAFIYLINTTASAVTMSSIEIGITYVRDWNKTNLA